MRVHGAAHDVRDGISVWCDRGFRDGKTCVVHRDAHDVFDGFSELDSVFICVGVDGPIAKSGVDANQGFDDLMVSWSLHTFCGQKKIL
jgi:hypothetical protein